MTLTQKILAITSGSILLLGLGFFLLFLNHTSINEIGIEYNSGNGKIQVQNEPGWYMTSPLVRVAYVSTLPMKITIPSNARVIVAKIVRFKPEGIKEYIRMQGFDYSMNSSVKNVLMGYAYSGNSYPFLDIMQEISEEPVDDLRSIVITDDVSNNVVEPTKNTPNDTIK